MCPPPTGAIITLTGAATEGLVSGIGDNQYGPEQTLSNAQFVTMICNMFYKTAVAANQNSSGQWWYPYMAAATRRAS